jgi:sulfite exporter TauE/SafE
MEGDMGLQASSVSGTQVLKAIGAVVLIVVAMILLIAGNPLTIIPAGHVGVKDFLWKGIEATEKLAQSANTKIVVIGNPKNGMPIILGGQQ